MALAKMADIAEAAGVSIATVGRVIHKNGYVSPEAREKVEAAVKTLGYVPNRMARTLKRQKSGIIGSLITHNQNYLYEKINSSIIEAADKMGFELLTLEGRRRRGDEERLINQFMGLQVDGLVITSNRNVPVPVLEQLHAQGIPVVAVEREYPLEYVDNLIVRDYEGAFDAVDRMVKKGHRRIAIIARKAIDHVEQSRLNGYLEAVIAGGADTDPALVQLLENYDQIQGYKAMSVLLEMERPPTAVFATADTLAAGAMQLLYRQGIHIPDEMSIVGYDNVLAQSLAPQIDSVDLAVEDIGATVLELLVERGTRRDRPSQTRYINTVYVDRGTVKPLD